MPSIIIKNLPTTLHRRLKEQAKENHRSMAREALTILEQGLKFTEKRKLPPLRRGKFLLTNEWIDRARRQGHE